MQCYMKTLLLGVFISHFISISASINAELDFDLIGDGFHRILRYKINLKDLNESNCALALHISLPPAIYVNVDEIADFKRLGKAVACSSGEIDVELFAEKAKAQNVTICEEMKSSKSLTLSLPVHQRYKFSQDNGGYSTVNIPRPRIFVGCKNRLRDHRVAKINLCSPCDELSNKWREISYRMGSVDKVWQIPVGNLSHLSVVSYVTLAVTALGALAVLRSLLRLKRRFDTGVKED